MKAMFTATTRDGLVYQIEVESADSVSLTGEGMVGRASDSRTARTCLFPTDQVVGASG